MNSALISDYRVCDIGCAGTVCPKPRMLENISSALA